MSLTEHGDAVQIDEGGVSNLDTARMRGLYCWNWSPHVERGLRALEGGPNALRLKRGKQRHAGLGQCG